MILIFGTLFGIVLVLFSNYSNLNVLKYDKRHIE